MALAPVRPAQQPKLDVAPSRSLATWLRLLLHLFDICTAWPCDLCASDQLDVGKM